MEKWSSELVESLYRDVRVALEQGHLKLAQMLWLQASDLEPGFLMLTKLNNLAEKILAKKADTASKKMRLALLATSTADQFVHALKVNLRMRGFELEVYQSLFDTVEQEIFDANSGLYSFKPTHVVIWNCDHDLDESIGRSADSIELTKAEAETRKGLWTVLHDRIPNAQILQTTFVAKAERTYGHLASRTRWSRHHCVEELNCILKSEAPEFVNIVDFEFSAQKFGKARWFDDRLWNHSKHAFSLDAVSAACHEVVRIVTCSAGQAYKCLVLDLDNTLWGGVIGDDGVEGIDLGQTGEGEGHVALQRYAKHLKDRGVILAVCSKNFDDVARTPFQNHVDMVLKEEDISYFVANWDNKAQNIRHIADHLEIGLDSMVFFDDNPAERKVVRDFLPEVYTVEVPDDPSLYATTLERLGLFDILRVTDEDFKRTEQYRANNARKELQKSIHSLEDYLQSLQMCGFVNQVTASTMERPLQLINKSNQFNLVTNRYTESTFLDLLKNPSNRTLSLRLTDRFGDNGLIAVVILRFEGKTCEIADWVMSCRVLNRGMENFTFNAISKLAIEKGASELLGIFKLTSKNKLVENLLPSLGFSDFASSESGKIYKFDLKGFSPRPCFIETDKIEEERKC